MRFMGKNRKSRVPKLISVITLISIELSWEMGKGKGWRDRKMDDSLENDFRRSQFEPSVRQFLEIISDPRHKSGYISANKN